MSATATTAPAETPSVVSPKPSREATILTTALWETCVDADCQTDDNDL